MGEAVKTPRLKTLCRNNWLLCRVNWPDRSARKKSVIANHRGRFRLGFTFLLFGLAMKIVAFP